MAGSQKTCRLLWLPALLVILMVGACAGPKRLPPVEQSGDRPGNWPTRPVGVPALLAVGLLEQEPVLTVGALGPAAVLAEDAVGELARVNGPGSSLVCRRQGDSVLWEAAGRSGRTGALRLQPIDPAHHVVHGEATYRGDLLVIPTPGGSGLTLINTLDLESYLRGVVPWEIGRHGEDKLAALQAQAVAARTYTISHLGARLARGFDVYASVMDQVYRGSADEDPLCNRAIADTEGLILSHGGRPINAYYSACCGGISSRIDEVWAYPPEAYLKSRPDTPAGGDVPFCADYRHFNWRETWTAGLLEETLQETLPAYLAYMAENQRPRWSGPHFTPAGPDRDPARPGALLDMAITGYTSSGRVDRLDVTTTAGVYHVRGDRTRWVLKPETGPPAILRSALFEVELTRRGGVLTEVAARGRGYGHGIGMCQSGALAMAEDGYTFREILAHYYDGASLEQVPDE